MKKTAREIEIEREADLAIKHWKMVHKDKWAEVGISGIKFLRNRLLRQR